MTTMRMKPKSHRPPRPAPKAYAAISSPSPADIKAKLQPLQQPMTADRADSVLAKNGVPPASAEETWAQALSGLGAVAGRSCRRGCELFGTAIIAVATPLLTAAVDGLGLLIAAMTVYELWRPVEALADAVLRIADFQY